MRIFIGGFMNSQITITDMNSITMNEIKHIVGFDGNTVALDTERGRVMIEGSDLKVESLEKEEGKIVISGNFKGLFFAERKPKSGILDKLFK